MFVEFNLFPTFEMLPIPCLQVVTKTKMEKIILNYAALCYLHKSFLM